MTAIGVGGNHEGCRVVVVVVGETGNELISSFDDHSSSSGYVSY